MAIGIQVQLTEAEAFALQEALALYVENRLVNDDGTDRAGADAATAQDLQDRIGALITEASK